jgi:hypothetical protein
MTPIEAMAKAIASEDWGHGRAGGPWSEELWERLLAGYRQMERENPDIIEAHYLWRVFRQARAALLALAEVELPAAAIMEGMEAYEDHLRVSDENSRFGGIEASLKAMLRSIAEGGKS